MAIIQASIPLFFLLIGLELLVAAVRKERLARLNDSITDLSLGIFSQLAGIFTKLFSVGIYIAAAQYVAVQRFTSLPGWIDRPPFLPGDGWLGLAADWPALASWAAVFVLVDLCYYWSHRLSHVVNVLWAGHVVHHSSEEYNLTVALRQSSLHGLFTWVFYLPLALIGIPPEMFIASYALNLVYQFWIHTRAVGRLGWLETVMNTPSHHRVHHGVNPRYLDRNYAGVFIVWDRMFGTFEPEREPPVYGITTPLASWNPIWANVHHYVTIARKAWRAERWSDRWHVVFGHPAWRPASEGGPVAVPEVSAESFQKFDPPLPRPVAWYALLQFAVTLIVSVQILAAAGTLATVQLVALTFFVMLSLVSIAGLMERQRWALPMEAARLVAVAGAAAALSASGEVAPATAAGLAAVAAASGVWLHRLRRHLNAELVVAVM
jgi:sterol desaturase/sphingolipid hydroxylase (fatty acid hydroxylase superfamily)